MKPSKHSVKRILHTEHPAEGETGIVIEHEEQDRRDVVRVSIWDRKLEDAFARLTPAQARALAATLTEVADKVDALRPSNVIRMAAGGARGPASLPSHKFAAQLNSPPWTRRGASRSEAGWFEVFARFTTPRPSGGPLLEEEGSHSEPVYESMTQGTSTPAFRDTPARGPSSAGRAG